MQENNIKGRFLTYVRYKGITQREFYVRCGITPGYMDRLKRFVGDKKATSIRENFPDLNIQWLETGYGNMLMPDGNTAEEPENGCGLISESEVTLRIKIASLEAENMALHQRLQEQKDFNEKLWHIIDKQKGGRDNGGK